MSSRLEKLMLSVALIDKASGPASRITQSLDKLTSHATKGFSQVAMGAAGLFATGYALRAVMGPAIEMDRALGEVRSLGVADAALQSLERQALAFSVQYGESAVDITRSGYAIQQSIDSLHGDQLGKVTALAGVLAKGTRQDFESVAGYTRQMFAVFEHEARQQGNVNFMERLVGQTAVAAEVFQVEAKHFGSAMSNVGNLAAASNIPMEEQLAVIGTLTRVMGDGSKAGAGYATFLRGISRAQDVLGLSLTDAEGRALPMMDIISRIQGRYGDLSDAATQDLLQKAFGARGLGVITAVSANLDAINDGVQQLQTVTDASAARTKAAAIADPWERLEHVFNALRTVVGRTLQPVLYPLIDSLIDGANTVVRWTELFPHLTKAMGTGVLVVVGLVAAVSAFALVSGIAHLAMVGWHGAVILGSGAMALWRLGVIAAQASWFVFQLALWGGSAAFGALRSALVASSVATWLFNSALLANPITWIVLGIVALTAAVVGAIVYWKELTQWFGALRPIQLLGGAIDWLIDKLNRIPGIDIGTTGELAAPVIPEAVERASTGQGMRAQALVDDREQTLDDLQRAAPSLQGGRSQTAPAGGLLQQISNATTNNQGTTIEKMEVNTTGGVDGYQLQDELMWAAG